MSTTAHAHQNPRGSNLDVDWLLHGKRDFSSSQPKDNNAAPRQEPLSSPPPREQVPDPIPKYRSESPSPTPRESPAPSTQTEPQKPRPVHTNSKHMSMPAMPSHSVSGNQVQAARAVAEDPKKAGRGLKKESRRSSWFSSLGHKISGSSSHTSSRTSSIDSMSPKASSPKHEFSNPFDKNAASPTVRSPQQEKSEVLTHHPPQATRRPSVLVAAGTETKLDQPGFLTSALRRLSSGNAAQLGKGAGSTNSTTPRRIMNIDQNRERSKISELDQGKLKRVAFCVDVEIAGVASQADEDGFGPMGDPVGHPATSNSSKQNIHRSSMSAKYKEKGEGKALKDPETATEEKETLGKPKEDIVEETNQQRQDTLHALEGDVPETGDPDLEQAVEKPTTRKKEKKKRSEAERKERRERKRRHAEMNGLIPLELKREDTETDSESCDTPAGASTPRNGDKPTTNPLRIYKRCCQLRETTALSLIKEQISKPAATLAEAPGTVGMIDLSGSKMSLQDIATFGDWLAVVPVRKLRLDDCGLGDEAIRIILSGLLGVKTSEQARANRKLPRRGLGKRGQEQLGVIERLSLKNNTAITNLGWKHIALFVHLSQSLCAIDLTGIPYPKSGGDLSRTNTTDSNMSPQTPISAGKVETGSLVARAIYERIGNKLEELILSGCSLTALNVSELIDAAIECKIRRLGLAGNNLDNEAMGHVVRYALSDVCEGLDLGSNDLHGNTHLLSQVVHENNPMFALSLADCNLSPEELSRILPALCEMKNFKFLDLSHNHGLFEGEETAVHLIRKHLPRMRTLKRLHLADVGLRPDHIIAISDVFPDCSSLAHINILENVPLIQKMNSPEVDNQEEAAAFLASLMTATRVSRTLVAVELEVPGFESSEVVKALSQQIVAYSLRNMERSTLTEFGVESKSMPDKDAPEVLLHLVGQMDGYNVTSDTSEPVPDEDYLIASTGVVKALSVCLSNKDASRNASRSITPTASGTSTPQHGSLQSIHQRKQPKDVSRELCDAARKIRARLQPALVKEDQAGNSEAYRRLWFLDQTLQGIIKRFEDEYPSVRPATPDATDSELYSPPETPELSRMSTQDGPFSSVRAGYVPKFHSGLNPSPSASSTSLASKALSNEEGRMHKFGASMRRELFKPVGTDDHAYGTTINDDPEPAHLVALRSKLAGMSGDELRQKIEREGADNVVKELEINAQELQAMAVEDPIGFEALRHCTLMNEVRRMSRQLIPPINPGRKPDIPGTFHEGVAS